MERILLADVQRFIPNGLIFVCAEKQAYRQKEKEKQTETETKLETISKFLVGPIHVPIHFQGETKNKKNKR